VYCTLAADGVVASIDHRARLLMKDERQETSALCHGENESERVSLVRPLKRESGDETETALP
jgi:hypothetical protein